LLPQKKTRRKQVALVENCAWIVHAGRILLEYQRGSRWSGMWKLPALSATPDQPPLHTLEYPFTHHRVALSIFQKRSPRILRESLAWHAWDVLDSIPIPSPHRRAIEHIHRAQVPG
jgi:A/G-specific adenine glycosylase